MKVHWTVSSFELDICLLYTKQKVMIMKIPEHPFTPRVLLVDDEIQQLCLCAEVMKSCGFAVITAHGPMAAISSMTEGEIAAIDVAVLDYNMPVMNGSALARRFRSMCLRLKVILHSGALVFREVTHIRTDRIGYRFPHDHG
jgi:response regulator RpfG family c-di-GMP phosphodiesterase